MMEALDESEHDVRFVMTIWGVGKNYESFIKDKEDKIVSLTGLKSPVLLVTGEQRYSKKLGRFRSVLAQIRRIKIVCRECKEFNPDLIYIDRTNVLSGAFLSRFMKKPVFLRVMGVGVFTAFLEEINSLRLKHILDRWAFRSPFSHVLCTEDGSSGEFWMDKFLSPDVTRQAMLNGVDTESIKSNLPLELESLPDSLFKVIFVGRLEDTKGCLAFVDAIIKLYPDYDKKVKAIVVGTGAAKEFLITRIKEFDAESMFVFIDRVSHSVIHDVYKMANVYVSLNHLGNLSNTNLESFSNGTCTIMPVSQLDKKIDLSTDKLISKDAVIRIPWENQTNVLAEKIKFLAANPELVDKYSSEIKKVSKKLLKSWNGRINEEMLLFKNIINQ